MGVRARSLSRAGLRVSLPDFRFGTFGCGFGLGGPCGSAGPRSGRGSRVGPRLSGPLGELLFGGSGSRSRLLSSSVTITAHIQVISHGCSCLAGRRVSRSYGTAPDPWDAPTQGRRSNVVYGRKTTCTRQHTLTRAIETTDVLSALDPSASCGDPISHRAALAASPRMTYCCCSLHGPFLWSQVSSRSRKLGHRQSTTIPLYVATNAPQGHNPKRRLTNAVQAHMPAGQSAQLRSFG